MTKMDATDYAILELLKKDGRMSYSDIAEEAEQFGEDIKKEFGFRDVFYTYIGTTIGSNCGPGLMAAFFVGKKRTN